MLEALRELNRAEPIEEAKFDPEKVDVSNATKPVIPNFGIFLALEKLLATGASYESLDKMSMEELKSKYNEGAEKLFKEYQEEIRKCMPPKDADIDEFDIKPLAQVLTGSNHPRVLVNSESEWINKAQEILDAEYVPQEDLDILNIVKDFIHDCLRRDADIKAIQQRAKEDYERRGFLGKLFWRGYSDNKKHFNGSRSKDSLFVRNRRESVEEALDEEAEYAIYMFDGESGPSEDDSDPVAIFVASNADEAEEKFQDFVAENSAPHSHVVYRYGKLHEAVEEDEDFWDDDDEKFEEKFEEEFEDEE